MPSQVLYMRLSTSQSAASALASKADEAAASTEANGTEKTNDESETEVRGNADSLI